MIKRIMAILFCMTLFAGVAIAAEGEDNSRPKIDEGCTAAKPVKGQTGACYACNSLKIRNSYQYYLEQCPQYKKKYKATRENYTADVPQEAKAMQKQQQKQNGSSDASSSEGSSSSVSSGESSQTSKGSSSSADNNKTADNKSKIGSRRNTSEKKVNDCPLDMPAMDMSGNCHKCSDMVIRRNPGRYANVCVGGKPVDFTKPPVAGKGK